MLAGFIARLLGHLLRLRRNSARLALMLILLMIGTGGLSAFFTFVNLYMNEVHWHAPFPSILWFIQTVYTAISAGYIFAVIGTRLFLPFGLLVLFCAAIVATRDRQRL